MDKAMNDSKQKTGCKYQCKNQNALLDKLIGFRIQGEYRQVFDLIKRKSVGWDKKTDKIALSQFELCTGLRKPNICRALSTLEKHRIIIVNDNDDIKSYGINLSFSEWIPLLPLRMLSESKKRVIREDNHSLSEPSTTNKGITKGTTKKENNSTNAEYIEIAEILREKTIQGNPKARITDSQVMSWARIVSIMVEQDGIAPDDIRAVINWSKGTEGVFWSPLIVSMQKVREKWNTLTEQMSRRSEKAQNAVSINWEMEEDYGIL